MLNVTELLGMVERLNEEVENNIDGVSTITHFTLRTDGSIVTISYKNDQVFCSENDFVDSFDDLTELVCDYFADAKEQTDGMLKLWGPDTVPVKSEESTMGEYIEKLADADSLRSDLRDLLALAKSPSDLMNLYELRAALSILANPAEKDTAVKPDHSSADAKASLFLINKGYSSNEEKVSLLKVHEILSEYIEQECDQAMSSVSENFPISEIARVRTIDLLSQAHAAFNDPHVDFRKMLDLSRDIKYHIEGLKCMGEKRKADEVKPTAALTLQVLDYLHEHRESMKRSGFTLAVLIMEKFPFALDTSKIAARITALADTFEAGYIPGENPERSAVIESIRNLLSPNTKP